MIELPRIGRRHATALIAFALTTATGSVWADTWPSKPVKIVVPYAPGGAVDVVTRKMAQKLTEQTGQNFFVENKAGATGTIGAQQVVKAEPDGYTLMANDTTYSLLPHIFKKLPFDHATDLVAVGARRRSCRTQSTCRSLRRRGSWVTSREARCACWR